MNDEQLLTELEDLLRNTPESNQFPSKKMEIFSWLGRLASGLVLWDELRGGMATVHIQNVQSYHGDTHGSGYQNIMVLLHQAISDLRMKTTGPLSIAVTGGSVFDYFDEIRKILEAANQDVLFIDPYLDAEFVSRYLPHIKHDVSVRLLAQQKLKTLRPSIEAYRAQSGQQIELRSAGGFHDRYIFVDGLSCYQSGASFKDGAKKALTTLTQITDAFEVVQSTYEEMWVAATILDDASEDEA